MRRQIYISLLALLFVLPVATHAQQLFNSEIAPYEARRDAEQRNRVQKEFYQDFAPKPIFLTDSTIIVRQLFPFPNRWSGRVVTLHAEGVGSAYDLIINDRKVLSQEDPNTPININISKYLSSGVNRIDLILKDSRFEQINIDDEELSRVRFAGSYISAQPALHIHDVDVELTMHPQYNTSVLNITVALRNDFSAQESVDVGYDIYDPSGKLLDYTVNEFTVAGGQTDTITFNPIIMGANSNRWSPKSPKLYKVMVYTRRQDVITEYIPCSVGFLDLKYVDGTLYNFDEPLTFKVESYNALGDRAQSLKEMRAIKAKGVNTLSPSYPQPVWFYELCDELGFWVIDQVNINATRGANDRRVGGTPSNDPALVGEYLCRAKSAYYRSRSFGSVIAYSLGGDESGNGYNMYRVYEWMKGVEKSRPIIYKGANAEWNSDIIEGLE